MRGLVKILLFIVSGFLSTSGFSQLVTSTSQTPTQLVENVLVGNGVAVSNVTFTGNAEAIGSFNGANTNLGLDNGIILTTGTVLNSGGIFGGNGPHGPNDSGSAGTDNGEPGYGPLTSLAGADTYNAAILEFDFVPQSDSVKFRYVFGSDEYPEFVDGGFNDAFAFFITGPGFGGAYNMATIPGGGGPVSIDNINNGSANTGPCQNCSYYVNNGTGSTSPQDASDFYIQYDGFTVVIEASAQVQCGETYHLVISIADAGDGAYDSGIFLEANSLDSNLPVEMNADLDLDKFGDGISMAEGCETATITVSRDPGSAGDALTIPLTVLGTATEGVDYGNIPPSITFAAGQTQISFDFDIFADGLTEGDETVIIQLNQLDPCGNSNFITVSLVIKDVHNLEASVDDVDVHCSGDEVVLAVHASGGLPDYSYSWAIGGNDETLTVAPGTTTSYDVTVNDACLNVPLTVSGVVTVPDYPPLLATTTGDTSVLCPNTPVQIAAEATGGEGSFTYSWSDGSTSFSNSSFVTVSPMVTTVYTATITDGCGAQITTDIIFTVEASVLELVITPDQLICPGDTADISVQASQGLGNYTYYWFHSGGTSPDISVSPDYTSSYTVSVEDDCHTYDIQAQTTVNVVRPQANFNVMTEDPMEGLLVGFQNTTEGGVTYYWDMGNGEITTNHSATATYNPWGWYNVTLIAYNEIGCTDTITKPIYIKPEFYFYAPNAFTPDGNRFNNSYSVSMIGATEVTFQIFNRWGELIYETNDLFFQWDGTYKNNLVQDEVVVYKAVVMDREEQLHEYSGTITILR